MPLITPQTLLSDTPGEWFLEATCRCETYPPRSIPIRGLLGMGQRPNRTLAEVAAQLVCVRCGKRAQRVVLVDQRTPRLVADHFPEQIVRMTVLER